MSLKAVRLLFVSALFFSMLFAASVLLTANCGNVSQTNVERRPETDGRSSVVFVGDPVGGGIPCENQRETQTENRTV